MDDIFVNLTELPATVRSFVISHADQTYTIVLNSRLSHEQNILSYHHELNHIRNGDYEKEDVDNIEHEAHQ